MKKDNKKIKNFTLGSVKWTVKTDNDRCEDTSTYGFCEFGKSQIILFDKNPDLYNETLWHEVIHACLLTMGEYELNNNERFVQSFAVLLNQFDKSRK